MIDGYLKPLQAERWDRGALLNLRAFSIPAAYDYAALAQPVLLVQASRQQGFVLAGSAGPLGCAVQPPLAWLASSWLPGAEQAFAMSGAHLRCAPSLTLALLAFCRAATTAGSRRTRGSWRACCRRGRRAAPGLWSWRCGGNDCTCAAWPCICHAPFSCSLPQLGALLCWRSRRKRGSSLPGGCRVWGMHPWTRRQSGSTAF